MKNLLVAALLLLCGANAFAQTTAEQRKAFIEERKANMQMASEALGKKVTKIAAKEAKTLAKEGWKPTPGGLPLNVQLTDFYTKQYMYDGSFPKYIIGNGQTVGGNIASARKQALSLATVDVADMLESEVTELTENSISNAALNANDAESIAKTVAASKVLVEQNIKNLKPGVEMYRDLPNGNKEVSIKLLYDGSKARAVIIQELEKESKELGDKLDQISK